jgi:hypothetical protein
MTLIRRYADAVVEWRVHAAGPQTPVCAPFASFMGAEKSIAVAPAMSAG